MEPWRPISWRPWEAPRSFVSMMSRSTSRLLGFSTRCTAASRRAPAPSPPRGLHCAGLAVETLRLSGLAPAVIRSRSEVRNRFCRSSGQISFPAGEICNPAVDVQPRRDIAWTWYLDHRARLNGSSLNLPPPDQSPDPDHEPGLRRRPLCGPGQGPDLDGPGARIADTELRCGRRYRRQRICASSRRTQQADNAATAG